LDEEIMSKNSMDMEDEYEETITDIDTLMTIEEEGECGTDNFKFSFE